MTPYFSELNEVVARHGGFFNAHLHLDRAGTYHPTVLLLAEGGEEDGTLRPLAGKHAIIPMVHASSCYDPDVLYTRGERYIAAMIEAGTTRADTVVDTTTDRVGLDALCTFARLKHAHASKIDLQIGAYSPLGFRDDDPARWDLLEVGAGLADFVGLLPERDDQANYSDHIGFTEACRRGLTLAWRLGKKIHIHLDQANHAFENGTELVCGLIEDMGLVPPTGEEPFAWFIHVISPSAYNEDRFADLAMALARNNIGVICCPSAAISMRQYRPFAAPTHNSIARVLELIAAGVHVRIGSDNVCDITSPMGTPDLMDEVKVLGDALRYYDIDVLARIAAGKRPDGDGLERLRRHLATDRAHVDQVIGRFACR